jgi:arylsulfatase A
MHVPRDRPIDGRDFSAIFHGKPIERTIPLHWHFHDPIKGPQSVLREGDWIVTAQWDVGDYAVGRFQKKYIDGIKTSSLVNFKLYNIRDDVGQTIDLNAKYPQRLKSMSKMLEELHHQVQLEAPTW